MDADLEEEWGAALTSSHDAKLQVYHTGEYSAPKELSVNSLWSLRELLTACGHALRLHTSPSVLYLIDGNRVEEPSCLMSGDIVIACLQGEDLIAFETGRPSASRRAPSRKDLRSARSGADTSRVGSAAPHVGVYRMGRVLGEGGFGTVRLGTHMATGQLAAMKFLSKAHYMSPAEADRILTEISCLAELDHPNIVKLIEVINRPDDMVIILEFAAGGDLKQYVAAQPEGRLSDAEASDKFVQIVRGVQYAHSHKIVHHDLKLENILLGARRTDACSTPRAASGGGGGGSRSSINGARGDRAMPPPGMQCLISDFGLSQYTRSQTTMQVAGGSLFYMSPEVVQRQATPGPAVDMWCLGVMLYAMLVGQLPFRSPTLDAAAAALKQDHLAQHEERMRAWRLQVEAAGSAARSGRGTPFANPDSARGDGTASAAEGGRSRASSAYTGGGVSAHSSPGGNVLLSLMSPIGAAGAGGAASARRLTLERSRSARILLQPPPMDESGSGTSPNSSATHGSDAASGGGVQLPQLIKSPSLSGTLTSPRTPSGGEDAGRPRAHSAAIMNPALAGSSLIGSSSVPRLAAVSSPLLSASDSPTATFAPPPPPPPPPPPELTPRDYESEAEGLIDTAAAVREVRAAILEGKLFIPDTVSPAAADLIRRLLHPDASQRLSIAGVLSHPWLAGQSHAAASVLQTSAASSPLDDGVPSASSASTFLAGGAAAALSTEVPPARSSVASGRLLSPLAPINSALAGSRATARLNVDVVSPSSLADEGAGAFSRRGSSMYGGGGGGSLPLDSAAAGEQAGNLSPSEEAPAVSARRVGGHELGGTASLQSGAPTPTPTSARTRLGSLISPSNSAAEAAGGSAPHAPSSPTAGGALPPRAQTSLLARRDSMAVGECDVEGVANSGNGASEASSASGFSRCASGGRPSDVSSPGGVVRLSMGVARPSMTSATTPLHRGLRSAHLSRAVSIGSLDEAGELPWPITSTVGGGSSANGSSAGGGGTPGSPVPNMGDSFRRPRLLSRGSALPSAITPMATTGGRASMTQLHSSSPLLVAVASPQVGGTAGVAGQSMLSPLHTLPSALHTPQQHSPSLHQAGFSSSPLYGRGGASGTGFATPPASSAMRGSGSVVSLAALSSTPVGTPEGSAGASARPSTVSLMRFTSVSGAPGTPGMALPLASSPSMPLLAPVSSSTSNIRQPQPQQPRASLVGGNVTSLAPGSPDLASMSTTNNSGGGGGLNIRRSVSQSLLMPRMSLLGLAGTAPRDASTPLSMQPDSARGMMTASASSDGGMNATRSPPSLTFESGSGRGSGGADMSPLLQSPPPPPPPPLARTPTVPPLAK